VEGGRDAGIRRRAKVEGPGSCSTGPVTGSGRCSTSSTTPRTTSPDGLLWPQEEAELYACYGLPYTGASLVDLDEEDEDAAAQIRGLPPR
jgi:hypothetical protein